jgi:hypothetical protein
MKSLLIAAALAASAATGFDVHLVQTNGPAVSCAQRLLGKQLLGLGIVKVASTEPTNEGKYLVIIESPHASSSEAGKVKMLLGQDQLCDFANSVESSTSGARP